MSATQAIPKKFPKQGGFDVDRGVTTRIETNLRILSQFVYGKQFAINVQAEVRRYFDVLRNWTKRLRRGKEERFGGVVRDLQGLAVD